MALPTLWLVDGFEHGLATATGTTGVFDGITSTPAINATTPRTGGRCLEVAAAGAARRAFYTLPGTPAVVTSAFAVYFPSALPSADCQVASLTHSGANNAHIRFINSSDRFAVSNNNTDNQVFGPNPIAVDTWYLIVFEADASGGTCNVRGKCYNTSGTIIGSEATSSRVFAAGTYATASLGTSSAETITARYDDWLLSVTDGDYELWLAPWEVQHLHPTADGSHNISAANIVERSATGTDITNATTDAYTLVDDDGMDVTPTDYINHVGVATSDYTEVVFEDLPADGKDVVDVRGYLTGTESSGTGTTLAKAYWYDTDTTFATLSTDVWNGADPGTTVKTYARNGTAVKVITRPSGGWTRTKANALRARVGYGDGQPDVWFATVMTEVAVFPATNVDATATPTKVSAVAAVATPTATVPQTTTPSVIAGVTAVATPTVVAHATATPAKVSAVAAVATPTTIANGLASASVINGVTAVATPTVTATAAATPSVVAGVAAVPTPAVIATGDGLALPSTVAAVAAVPQAVGSIPATATPTVLAAVGAVATPTAVTGTVATASVVAGVAALPAPSVQMTAAGTPSKVSAVAAVATPTATGTAVATPGVVTGIGAVATPTVLTGTVGAPAVIAGVAAVATPTVTGTAVATPAKVSSIAAVPTPNTTASANTGAVPTITAVASVPNGVATSDHGADATPAVVAAVSDVPTPVVIGDALAEPVVIAAVTFIGARAVVDNSWRASEGPTWPQADDTAWAASDDDGWEQAG